jgi:hypothetical protein
MENTPAPAKTKKNKPMVLTVMRIDRGKTVSPRQARTNTRANKTSPNTPPKLDRNSPVRDRMPAADQAVGLGRKTCETNLKITKSAKAARANTAVRLGLGMALGIESVFTTHRILARLAAQR